MKVNFYATLRQIVGQKTIEISLENEATVQDLLDEVVNRYPLMRRELLNDDGVLYPHVHLFVNGRDAPYLEDEMESILQPEDKIDIFPAVGGGEANLVRVEREVRGIPLWLIETYLEDLGGKKSAPGEVVGENWQAWLTQLEDFQLGSLAVGQVRIVVEATHDAMEKLQPGLEKKLLRAGG